MRKYNRVVYHTVIALAFGGSLPVAGWLAYTRFVAEEMMFGFFWLGISITLFALMDVARRAAGYAIMPRRYARPVAAKGFDLIRSIKYLVQEQPIDDHPMLDLEYAIVEFENGDSERVFWSDLYQALSADYGKGKVLTQRWVREGKLTRSQWEAMRWVCEQSQIVSRNGRGELRPLPYSPARLIEIAKSRFSN